MKLSTLVLIAIVCMSLVVAKVRAVWTLVSDIKHNKEIRLKSKYFQEDPLDVAMDKCLNKLNLLEAEELSEKQEDCLAGCMLQEFKMVTMQKILK